MPQWAFYVNISVRIEIKNEMMIRILPCDKITSSIHVTVTLSIATSEIIIMTTKGRCFPYLNDQLGLSLCTVCSGSF